MPDVLQQRVKRSRFLAKPVRTAVAVAVALALTGTVAAQEFVVRDIRVEGIQRTEAGTVFSYLPLRVGDRFDPERGVAAIRALYATGLFKDVRLEVEGNTLVVIVEERPSIAVIDLNGVKEFDKDAVKKSLREVGLAEARVFDRSLLERAEQELKRQYLSKGLYGVEITSTVTPVERNRVNVTIAVEEGEVARIRSIQFTGNKAYSESALRSEIELRTPGWFTWYTKSDRYARQKLAADLETLRSFYLNRGYLDFNIESTQVSISPDKNDIFITINLIEGERYTISGVKLQGELLGLDEELGQLVDVKAGETFNAERLNNVSKRITDRLSALGYAFATANPVPEANRDKREVAFTLLVDPGRRVYVRRVNVVGNTKTRDDVIRREVRQFEGAWFDAEKVRLSRDRIDRLGFFEKVEMETPAVSGSIDQVDVNVKVQERPTGSIQAGVGYSSAEKVVLQGSYSQQNVLGSGQNVSVEINTSRATRTLVLSHTDPYVTQDGISRTIDLRERRSNLSRLDLAAADFTERGGSVRYGVPFTEFDTVFFGLGYEQTQLTLTDTTRPDARAYGSRFAGLIGTVGWSRDSRDNILVPTRGQYQRGFAEIGTPALDMQYYKLTYQFQRFQPVTSNFTLAFNTELGYGDSYGGEPYPWTKNFYGGGIGSVRGFEQGSLGPFLPATSTTGRQTLGGTRKVNASLEALLPLPGADRTLRGLVFVDAGQVWGNKLTTSTGETSSNPGGIRSSYGFGIAWISPIGPLKLSYALPLKKEPTDRLQRFQFQIGTGF